MTNIVKFVIVALLFSSAVSEHRHHPHPPKDDTYCVVCESVTSFVEKWIAEDKTIQEMELLLEAVCNYLPADYQETCDAVIVDAIPQIISYIEQEFPPSEFCSLLGLCVAENDGIYCVVCDTIISYVEKWIAEDKTDQEIEAMLEDVCALLPADYETVCDSEIKNYTPLIIEYIEQELPPDTICALVGLCI